MPDENNIDLTQVTDMAILKDMYIEYSEKATYHEEQANINRHNFQAIRQRMVQRQSELDAKIKQATPAPATPTKKK